MLNLEQILKVVKEKYNDAKIEPVVETIARIEQEMVRDAGGWETDNYVEIVVPDYQHTADSIVGTPFEILYNGNLQINNCNINNIIELKHYLDIEIKWEDLVEYCIGKNFELVPREETCYNYETIEEYLRKGIGIFYKYLEILKGGVIKFNDEELATNRSYWQIFNLIKNLME